MRAPEDHRPLTNARMGAAVAPIRAARAAGLTLVLACTAACADTVTRDVLRPAETVIGRARSGGMVMMLTDAPALLTFAADGQRATRVPLPSTPALAGLWGLGEVDGRLFSVSRFDRLIEIHDGGRIVEVAKLERPVANLIDIEAGMVAQLAGGNPGDPLTMKLDVAGRMSPHDTPARQALNVGPAEQTMVNLLSCSVPPQSVCWLPATPRILAWSGDRLRDGAVLAGVPTVPATLLVAEPERRVIEDVLVDVSGRYLVLRNESGGRQRLSWHTRDGQPDGELVIGEPLRLLVAIAGDRVRAVTRAGRLTALARR